MENPAAYIPLDRRQALIRGETLPERMSGAALFADISGFTPLAEALAQALGPRRAAEELTAHLNRVYNALIAELHRFRGSVITFGGDAITCWLDGDDGRRAIQAALAMQAIMGRFARLEIRPGQTVSLSMKAAVMAGPVRRLVVGQPDYLLVDVIAGATLDRLAAAEHQAQAGQVVVDEATAAGLGQSLQVAFWRSDPESGRRFGVVDRLAAEVLPNPWPPVDDDFLSDEQVRAWLLPDICQRIKQGEGEFLAELRPVVALFLRFGGIDYDADPAAGRKLDAFIRQVEAILQRYDGNLLQFMTGDKGSHIYAAFGAPIAHEDDAVRAAAAALDIQRIVAELTDITDLQVGITLGRLRTGAYGSDSRRTYSAIGDAVNLAARLMTAAGPGQILVSDPVRQSAADAFSWEALPPLALKGKREPVVAWRLLAAGRPTPTPGKAPTYDLPMVGRIEELALLAVLLDRSAQGRGQVVALTAEAGMGKSRLVAEFLRLAQERRFAIFIGECQSFGTNISYLAWQPIFREMLGLGPALSAKGQLEALEHALRAINPALAARLPLLSPAVHLVIADNDLTASLDVKVRKSLLEGLLVEILRHQARARPLVLVIEDGHWLDPLSHDLVEAVGRAIANLPVLLLLVYRPAELGHLQPPRIGRLPHFTAIALAELSPEESDRLIALKLDRLFGPQAALSARLKEQIRDQAAGNPFYLEELLNYLQDLGLDLAEVESLPALRLPDTLHRLILARIDRLEEGHQVVMKVASVVGRLFEAAMIWGVYPKVGEPERVLAGLETLRRLDLTQVSAPEPELAYLFKHIITQQVAYESLLYATRAMLHEQIGDYIEGTHAGRLSQVVYLLAHHYEHSLNEPKKAAYLLKAGLTAQRQYANVAAIDYFTKLLPLLPGDQRGQVLLHLGEVLLLIGRWDEAAEQYQAAVNLARELGDENGLAWAETAMAELLRKQGRYGEAMILLIGARERFEAMGDQAGVGQALQFLGKLADQEGDFTAAERYMQQGLALRQAVGDRRNSALILGDLGIVAARQGYLAQAKQRFEQSLALRREVGDRWGVANVLNNLGLMTLEMGDSQVARVRLEEAVAIHRELGDRWSIGNALNNLGNVLRQMGEYAAARRLYDESLAIYLDLEEKWALAYLFEDVGQLAVLEGQPRRALTLAAAAAALREEINAPHTPAEAGILEAALAPACAALGEDECAAARVQGEAMSLEEAVTFALNPAQSP